MAASQSCDLALMLAAEPLQDISKGLRFQVEALVGLRELCSVPEKERRARQV